MAISPSTRVLLTDLDPLPPGERFGAAIRHGRSLSAADRDRLLADLAGHDTYTRELAAAVAAGTGAGDHLAAALVDPNPRVRAWALRAAIAGPAAVAPETLAAAVDDGPLDLRLGLYRGLRRRPGAADELIGRVKERWGDGEAARLLPACSAGTVGALLPELAYAVPNWNALTARHPDAVREYAAAELAAATDAARPAWWARNPWLVVALARNAPGALLDLCERWLAGPLPDGFLLHLNRILAHDTGRAVRLVLADPARPRQLAVGWHSRRTLARLTALSDVDLGALLRGNGPTSMFLARVLHRLPPARREAVFDIANADRDLTTALLSDELLDVLPHARRHAETRRMLALPAVRTEPARTNRFSAFLPYDEAVAALTAATRGADPDERAAAYAGLIRAAAATGDTAAVTDLFTHLGRVRNEQDPVRSVVLHGLAERVRPELYDPEDPRVRDALDQLVRDALDARDRSYATQSAVHTLIFRVLTATAATTARPTAPPLLAWALDSVERLTLWNYAAAGGGGWAALRRGQEHEVFARIRPWLVAAVDRGQPAAALSVARALGRRAWAVTGLQELVKAATRSKQDGIVTQAVHLWLEPPTTRVERAAELVRRDESLVTLTPVLDVLARRRPDLVDSLILAGRPLKGRFGTRKARWIPALDARTVAAWTPGRIARYAELLRKGIGDKGLEVWSRAALTRVLAAVPAPAGGPTAVAGLLVARHVPVVEAALTGLGHSDVPAEALPVLLDHAGGDRARVAIFAAGRCVRGIRPGDLTAVLAAALDAPKITVRKEAARMLAATRPPGAVDALLAAWHRTGQHRDVRIALAAALRNWPADNRIWATFDGVAATGDRYLAGSLADVEPDSMPVAYRSRYAAVVRGLVHHPETPVVRHAYIALPAWLPWEPGCADDLAAAVTDLVPATPWADAMAALTLPAVWGSVPAVLPGVTRALVASSTEDSDAEPTRDRPARQRLRHLVDGLVGNAASCRRHPEPVRRTVDVLRADPSFVPEAARLAAVLPWPGPGLGAELAALADLLDGLPATAAAVAAGIPFATFAGLDPGSVDEAAATLARRPDVAAGLLAVALVAALGAEAGWPAPWREHLRALRRHAEAEVRHAALRPVTAPE
ncbi:HEAT repeat domain-containing protein [Virgisporangium aurantiacum]|uniref:HEAT repeat-containing protein n=1 Tax=Virgisporangium aurantiacum TaxID=175570 RepID=A0A8J3Z9Z7_9ACTN|nr:HEAT repeat domain-containing protein [Virgisporangium aurantiacum]GIJ60119.1 hypothetical protein Vau01_076350 [Virgisporangium aurantiacum]